MKNLFTFTAAFCLTIFQYGCGGGEESKINPEQQTPASMPPTTVPAASNPQSQDVFVGGIKVAKNPTEAQKEFIAGWGKTSLLLNDRNKNGLSDEVDAYIDRLPVSTPAKTLLSRFSTELQYPLTEPMPSASALKESLRKNLIFSFCATKEINKTSPTVNMDKVTAELEALTYNNYKKFERMNAAQKLAPTVIIEVKETYPECKI